MDFLLTVVTLTLCLVSITSAVPIKKTININAHVTSAHPDPISLHHNSKMLHKKATKAALYGASGASPYGPYGAGVGPGYMGYGGAGFYGGISDYASGFNKGYKKALLQNYGGYGGAMPYNYGHTPYGYGQGAYGQGAYGQGAYGHLGGMQGAYGGIGHHGYGRPNYGTYGYPAVGGTYGTKGLYTGNDGAAVITGPVGGHYGGYGHGGFGSPMAYHSQRGIGSINYQSGFKGVPAVNKLAGYGK